MSDIGNVKYYSCPTFRSDSCGLFTVMTLTYGIDTIMEMTRPDNLMKGVKSYVNVRKNMGVFMQTPGFKSLVD